MKQDQLLKIWTFLIVSLSILSNAHSQVEYSPANMTLEEASKFTSEKHFVYEVDIKDYYAQLEEAPRAKKAPSSKWGNIELMLSDGTSQIVRVAEAPLAQEPLYSRYRENKTYKVVSLPGEASMTGRIAISPKGLTGLLLFTDKQVYIEALGGGKHISYEPDASMIPDYTCGIDELDQKRWDTGMGQGLKMMGDMNGTLAREYVIAIAATGEFSDARGDNLATINADINMYLTGLNAFYESELAITFVLTANNDNLIFYDPATDPFDPASKLPSAVSGITGVLNDNEYDIGHVFNTVAQGGSGVAYLEAVCRIAGSLVIKAGGWTETSTSFTLFAYTGLWGHEIGHQLGAPHTFYGTVGNCDQRSVGNGYEPGSGNTIMAYEGICAETMGSCNGDHNIVPQVSSNYFHARSFSQILSYINTQSCATTTNTGNSIPILTMPANVYIPRNTPFELTATATDPDGDGLTYCWEQYDTDNFNLVCPQGNPDNADTSSTAPLFRSFDPVSTGYRSFPQNSDLISNTQTMGEILPNVARNITMRMTVRDDNPNGGAMISDDVEIEVVNTPGPFRVTVANTTSAYNAGQSLTVTWDVSDTDMAPISCSQVNILWSDNGGVSFPFVLASNVANNGSYNITVPNAATSLGRIKVKAVNNIFFDINDSDIEVVSGCNPPIAEIINNDAITAAPGDPLLDLNLFTGQAIDILSGEVNNMDPTVNLTSQDLMMMCTSAPFPTNFKRHKIMFEQGGNLRATTNLSWLQVMNLYQNELDVNNPCQNWLASNVTDQNPNPYFFVDSLVYPVSALTPYEFIIQGFPFQSLGTYSIPLSRVGQAYNIDFLPVGYLETYIIVDKSTNTIVAIETDPDLSNATSYSGGTYEVIGLFYFNTGNLNPYINGPKSSLDAALLSGTVCGAYTENYIDIIIDAGPCSPSTKTVTTALDDGSPGSLRSILSDVCGGDLILVDNGVSNIQVNNEIVFGGTCTIRGNGALVTNLDGQSNSRIFRLTNGANLTLEDIRLENGWASSNGGAILIENGANLFLKNCQFDNNTENGTPKSLTNQGAVEVSTGQVEIKQ